MAYRSQQPRFANTGNYYEAPRSAPLESPIEYQDLGYGGQSQQQDSAYNDGRSRGYNQGGRQSSSHQQYKQDYPRQGQGYQSQGRPQQNQPGSSAGHGQMRDQRGGRHNQEYSNGSNNQQNYNRRQDGYANDHHGQGQYREQYDDRYSPGQYSDGYGYEQNNYGQPQQQSRQPHRSEMNRAQSDPRQEYLQGGYDQRPPQGRSNKALPSMNGNQRDRQRITPFEPNSPDTLAWDNPFPLFPVHEKKRSEEQRPSTSTGQYREQTFASDGRGQQPIHDNYPAPNLANNHNSSKTLLPQPDYFQAPQRSNTMPLDLSQDMSNLNIQLRSDSNPQSRGQSPHQHLNFSQPRRPSAGNQGGSNSPRPSQTRQNNGYEDGSDSNPTRTMHSKPFESPIHEDMPNFGAVPGHDVDNTLQMASQAAQYDDRRGRNRTQEFQAQEQRSRSQPAARSQHDVYQTSTQENNPVPSMDPRYARSGQNNTPPKNVSDLQQLYSQENWQDPEQNEFGPPARARTDNFGPSQPIARNVSDPYRGAPIRGVGLTPSGQPRSSSSSQPGYSDPRSMTPANGQRSSSESFNRPGPGMTSSDTSNNTMNGNANRGSKPDSLPGHPTPVRPGLLGQGQMNQAGLAARPPPVRNYNGHPGSGPIQQQTSPAPQPRQQYQAPQPQVQPQPQQQAILTDDEPVTFEVLQRIRFHVQQNPSDEALQLDLAKKLLEAAVTLADEGGRADPKTKNKNRERYTMEANKLVKKLVGQSHTEAMFYMAECYGSGTLGLQKDPSQAFTLYQSAAKLNHAGAAYRVAVCCELGSDEGGGTKRDPLKAFQWYQRAATLGDVPAMYKTGVIQMKGLLGQPQNPHEAVTWLKKAAEQADVENPHALHELVSL